MLSGLWKKLAQPRIWRRIYVERLGEPLVYNIASIFVGLFGSVQRKIDYDLIPRHAYAFCVQSAATAAKKQGIRKIALLEFGVANGAGLMNLCHIAERVGRETGIEFEIIGFDSGTGMPPPRDYRDHPEKYFTGDFPLVDRSGLLAMLPKNARIIFGDISATLQTFAREHSTPIGFISIDVDYYWSTKEALQVLLFGPEKYLPMVYMYFDDVQDIDDNEFCGELLAIREFNQDPSHPQRRLACANFLSELRIFKRAVWHKQIYLAHVFDHHRRSIEHIKARGNEVQVLINPYT